MAEITLKNAPEFAAAELASFTNDAFDGYIGGSIQFDAAHFLSYCAGEGVNLAFSRVAMRDDQPAGIALITRQGWTNRLTLMGVMQEAQKKGIGTRFMQKLLEEALERGDRSYMLECIEQNEHGIRLYTRCGFEVVRQLLGYHIENPVQHAEAQEQVEQVEQVDLYELGKLLTTYGVDDLPWQVAGPEIMRLTPPHVAYHLDGAYAALLITPGPVVIRSIFTLPDARGKGAATRLLRHLFVQHPDKTWRIPAFCPAEFAPFLEAVGFAQDKISQVQMAQSLV